MPQGGGAAAASVTRWTEEKSRTNTSAQPSAVTAGKVSSPGVLTPPPSGRGSVQPPSSRCAIHRSVGPRRRPSSARAETSSTTLPRGPGTPPQTYRSGRHPAHRSTGSYGTGAAYAELDHTVTRVVVLSQSGVVARKIRLSPGPNQTWLW